MKRILPSLVAIFVAVSVAFAAASYPTSVKVFTTKAQNETIQPAHMNDVQDEIVAVEQGLLNGFQHDLKPDTDGGRALGTTALRFKNLRLFLGTLTDQLAAIDIAGTWNDAADTFTAIKANITDTASAAASLLIDLQVGGASKFKVEKDGDTTLAGNLTVTGGDITGVALVKVLNRDVVEVEVVNTTTETTVYTFSVVGGTLSTNNALRLTLVGSYLQNNTGTSDLTIRVKYGATTVTACTITGFTQDADRRTQKVVAEIHAKNATNAQVGSFVWDDGGAAGNGTGAANASDCKGGHDALAIDSTAAANLDVTVQHSVAAATISFIAKTVFVEVLR